MKSLLTGLTIPVLLLAVSLPSLAQAASSTIKLNDPTIAGKTDDGFNLNFVPATGLVWLDATVSDGQTTAQVQQLIANPKDALYGYRHANQNEIDLLLSAYGLPSNGEVPGAGAARSFMDDFGAPPGERTMLGPGVSLVWPVSVTLDQSKQIISRTEEQKSSVSQGGSDPKTKRAHFLVAGRQLIHHHDPAIKGAVADRNNLTFDSKTRLNWLDSTMTVGQSTQQIKRRLSTSGDALYGFRYANQSEIDGMLKAYGLPGNGEVPGTAAALSFMSDFGNLPGGRTMVGPSTTVMWPVSNELSQLKQIVAETAAKKSSVSQGGIAPDDTSGAIGHFLIRK